MYQCVYNWNIKTWANCTMVSHMFRLAYCPKFFSLFKVIHLSSKGKIVPSSQVLVGTQNRQSAQYQIKVFVQIDTPYEVSKLKYVAHKTKK